MYVDIGDYPEEGERKVEIRIDGQDVWSLDSTLAYVIAPALRRLQEIKHGTPFTEVSDAPNFVAKDEDEHGFSESRWNWILEEMCWAFEQVNKDWESKFHTGVIDIQWVPCGKKEADGEGFFEMKRGPNDTSRFDREGHKAYSDRMQRGFILFGKYYQSLWD